LAEQPAKLRREATKKIGILREFPKQIVAGLLGSGWARCKDHPADCGEARDIKPSLAASATARPVKLGSKTLESGVEPTRCKSCPSIASTPTAALSRNLPNIVFMEVSLFFKEYRR
jgi:hypothetical protein